MKKLHIILGILVLTFAGSAQAVLLSDLAAGGSITAGDKLFDEWEILFNETSFDTFEVNLADILVTALNDGGLDPGPGLNFSVQNGALDVIGDGIYAYADLQFGFRVSVLDPGLLIKDASLEYDFAFYGDDADGINDHGSYIDEFIGTAPGLDDLGLMNAEFSALDGVQTDNTTASASFAPQSELWVTKNILVWASDFDEEAGLEGFSQRFSQVAAVPEPSTFLLLSLGLGLAGAVSARRRLA